jgi:hypothetical protein
MPTNPMRAKAMAPLMHNSPEWTQMIKDVAGLSASFEADRKTRDEQHRENKEALAAVLADVSEIKETISKSYGGLSVGTKIVGAGVILLTLGIGIAGLWLQIRHEMLHPSVTSIPQVFSQQQDSEVPPIDLSRK